MSHLTPITSRGQTVPGPGAPAPGERPTAAAVLTARGRGGTPEGTGGPPVRSLYVHIPFCFHKCHYCDFYSVVDTQDRQEAFTERLVRELAALAPLAGRGPEALRTIFVGGGTPTLLRPDLWQRLLRAIDDLFDLSLIRAGRDERGEPTEWTVECNPETVTPELMSMLREGGVSRVSIGAQSFDSAMLKVLERWHDPDNVERAVEIARAAGIARQSVDLIFGTPGQTMAGWQADLERAIALGTTHLSCYALTYEPATALTARRNAGLITPIDEDLEAEMLLATVERLRTAGFERYEVSNFAKGADERSRHNLAYWRQEQWLAAGPSASGHVLAGADHAAGGWRWKNAPRLGDYLAIDDGGFAPVIDVEPPDPARALRERIMMGLRISEGLDAASILVHAAAVRPDLPRALEGAAHRLRDEGYLHDDPHRWRLTDRGFPLADWAAERLMRLV
jgi:oxygen-independent coproporphyrinogen-3 oxidase